MESKLPLSLGFDTVNVCSAKCIFCPYRFTKTKKKIIMGLDIYRMALEQYVNMGGKSIGLTPGIGDPLLDPYLFERLEYCKSYLGLKVALFTNGILLARDNNVRNILNSSLNEIFISTAGFDRNMYLRVMGVDTYNEFIKGLEQLLCENKQVGNRLKIGILLRPDDWDMLETSDFQTKIIPLLTESVSVSFEKAFGNWMGLLKSEHLRGDMRMRAVPYFWLRPCVEMFTAKVLPDGSIRMCSCGIMKVDELVIGNIKEKSLSEIWSSSVAKEIRRSRPEVCRNCSFYKPI